jgi:hypothetical protein
MANIATNFGGVRQAHLSIEVGTYTHVRQLGLKIDTNTMSSPSK